MVFFVLVWVSWVILNLSMGYSVVQEVKIIGNVMYSRDTAITGTAKAGLAKQGSCHRLRVTINFWLWQTM